MKPGTFLWSKFLPEVNIIPIEGEPADNKVFVSLKDIYCPAILFLLSLSLTCNF